MLMDSGWVRRMTTRIVGTGSYVPEQIVTNDDLAKIVETNDEWIRSRTGIGAVSYTHLTLPTKLEV